VTSFFRKLAQVSFCFEESSSFPMVTG
jgi:hypothetical protein